MNRENQTIASALQNSLLQDFDQSVTRGAGTIDLPENLSLDRAVVTPRFILDG